MRRARAFCAGDLLSQQAHLPGGSRGGRGEGVLVGRAAAWPHQQRRSDPAAVPVLGRMPLRRLVPGTARDRARERLRVHAGPRRSV